MTILLQYNYGHSSRFVPNRTIIFTKDLDDKIYATIFPLKENNHPNRYVCIGRFNEDEIYLQLEGTATSTSIPMTEDSDLEPLSSNPMKEEIIRSLNNTKWKKINTTIVSGKRYEKVIEMEIYGTSFIISAYSNSRYNSRSHIWSCTVSNGPI